MVLTAMVVWAGLMGPSSWIERLVRIGLVLLVFGEGLVIFLAFRINRQLETINGRLTTSERNYRAIFKDAPDAVCLLNSDGHIISANDAAFRLFHGESAWLLDKVLSDLVAPEAGTDPDTVRHSAHDSILFALAGQPETLEWRLNRPNGSGFLTQIHLNPVRLDDTRMVQAVLRDISHQRDLEENIRNSEKRFRDLVGTMSDIAWETDTEARITFVSGRHEQLLGYTSSEMVGKSVFDFLGAVAADAVRGELAHYLDGRLPFKDLVNWYIRKDGTRVCFLTHGVPMINDGKFLGYRGIHRDITERVESEQTLLWALGKTEQDKQRGESRERFLNAVLETAATAIFTVDKNRTILSVNDAFVASTGFSAREACGSDCQDVLHCQDCLGKCLLFGNENGEKIHRRHCRILAKDGKTRTIIRNASTATGEQGEEIGVESFVDITDLVHTREEVQVEALKLRTMIEGMEEGIVMFDGEGIVREVNPYFTRTFQTSREAMIGRKLFAFHPSVDPGKIQTILSMFTAGDRTPVVLHKQIGDRYYTFRVQPIAKDEIYRGALLNVVDITDLVACLLYTSPSPRD